MPTEVLQYSEGKSKSVLEIFLKKPEIHVDGMIVFELSNVYV